MLLQVYLQVLVSIAVTGPAFTYKLSPDLDVEAASENTIGERDSPFSSEVWLWWTIDLLTLAPSATQQSYQRLSGNSLFFKKRLPEVTVTSRGQNVILNCEGGGKPTPTIHWVHNGKRILQSHPHSVTDDEAHYEDSSNSLSASRLRLGETSGLLFLDCVTPADIGEYTCVLETPTHREVSTTLLDVEMNGAENECLPQQKAAARIYMWETSRLEYEGADVQLFCRASGHPAPQITWYDRNGDVINSDNTAYRLLRNGDLLIHSVSWMEHMGVFTCRAENSHGQDEVSSFLYPTYP